MNITAFKEGIASLAFLSKEEKEQSILVATALADDEREEMFERTKALNEQLKMAEKEEKEVLKEISELDRNLNSDLKKLQKSEEEKEKKGKLKAAEKKLSQNK